MKLLLPIIVLALALCLPARAQVSVSAPAEVPVQLSFPQLIEIVDTLSLPRLPIDNLILLTINNDGSGDIILSGSENDPVTEKALSVTDVTTVTTALGLQADMASAISGVGPVDIGIYAPHGLLRPCWLEVYSG